MQYSVELDEQVKKELLADQKINDKVNNLKLSYKNFFSTKNLIMIVIFALAISLFSFYFSCMSYAMIALAIKNEKFSLNNVLNFTNKFLLKLAGVELLVFLIITTIISVGVGISVFFLTFSSVLGFLLVPLIYVVFLIFIFIIILRVLYVIPIMFLEKEGPLKSIEHSFKLTRHHLGQVFVIFIILIIFSILRNYLSSPSLQVYLNLYITNNLAIQILSVGLLLFLFLAESAVLTFERVFLFYTYFDLDKIKDL